jgi:nicotinamide-nucleotide amidase
MSARAGIVVTGTEVLTGRVADRNGPWLAERLRERGIELAHTVIVGDRPEDVRDALGWLADAGMDLIVTSGGLGPTEDDLTASVVAEFQGRPMKLDPELEQRIWDILSTLRARFPNVDEDSIRRANRKQALVPEGATVLEPVGTAPGFVVPPTREGGPTVVVLPGPPRELQPMWRAAVETDAFRAAVAGADTYVQETMRLFGIPEAAIVDTMQAARDAGVAIDAMEITTCLRRGEVEVVTRYTPEQREAYAAFVDVVRERHGHRLFSEDGTTVDEQVATLLRTSERTIATAESCTGGLLAARLTERPGSSAYVLGGLVVYDNEAKVRLAGVEPALLERTGAVSEEVAEALAEGARKALGADIGVGITGIAGPDGGTPDKPVGTVCLSVCSAGARLTRRVHLPGSRADVRDRTTTVAMHLVRRLLQGAGDPVPSMPR